MARPLRSADAARIVEAIRAAERGNRGEVRVHIEPRCPGDPLARARDLYGHLGLGGTAGETGLLLYVAPRSRKVAVFAGGGIHDAVGAGAFAGIADAVAAGFSAGDGAGAILRALDAIGALLRAHLPGDPAGNERADEVTVS